MPRRTNLKATSIVILCLLILGWGVFSWPLISRHEARRAEIIRETLADNSWLIPRFQGKAYVTKPPLFTWEGVLLAKILGLREGVLRLPSLVGALFTYALVFALTSRYLGSYEAVWSFLILFANHKFFLLARRCEPETPFATLCFLGVTLFWLHLSERRLLYRYLAFISLGLAFLTKGPLALIIFPAILAYVLLRRDFKGLYALFDPLGWFLFGAVGLGWYLYAYHQLGPEPFHEFIFVDLLGRLEHDHRDSFFHYFLELLANSLPWSLIILFHPREFGKEALKKSFIFYFFLAVFVPVLLLSFTAQKFGKYLLPFYPSWSIILGAWWTWALREKLDIRKITRFAIILSLFIGLVHVLAEPYLNRVWLSSLTNTKPYLEKKEVYLFRFFHPVIAFYAASTKVIEDERDLPALPHGALLWVKGKDFSSIKDKSFEVMAHFKPFLRKGKEVWILKKGSPPSLKFSHAEDTFLLSAEKAGEICRDNEGATTGHEEKESLFLFPNQAKTSGEKFRHSQKE